jgi:hypothetical protein
MLKTGLALLVAAFGWSAADELWPQISRTLRLRRGWQRRAYAVRNQTEPPADGSGANLGTSELSFTPLNELMALGIKRPAQHSTVPTWSLSDPQRADLELALLDLLRQLDSNNLDSRMVESLEPEHRPDPLFHSPVVLFDEVVPVLTGSDSHSSGKLACLLHFPHGAVRCRVGVQGDLCRFARPLHRTAEKGLGRVHIAISIEKEIDRPACFVHRPIQMPRTFI